MANPKGNPQNLSPITSTEEAKKRGRKGGIKSQQVQRDRKKARECMNLILSLDVKGKKSKELMSKLGIEDEEQQNIMLLMSTLFMKAASSGDPTAVKSVLEIAGDMEGKQQDEDRTTINITVSAATEEDMKDETKDGE